MAPPWTPHNTHGIEPLTAPPARNLAPAPLQGTRLPQRYSRSAGLIAAPAARTVRTTSHDAGPGPRKADSRGQGGLPRAAVDDRVGPATTRQRQLATAPS